MMQPKFNVGDVVAYNDDAGHVMLDRSKPFKERMRLGCKGVITAFHYDCLDVGEFYSVSWFGDSGNSVNEVFELTLCKGMNDTELCDSCKHRIECGIKRG